LLYPCPDPKVSASVFFPFLLLLGVFFPAHTLWFFPSLGEDSARARMLRSAGQFFYFKTFNGVLALG